MLKFKTITGNFNFKLTSFYSFFRSFSFLNGTPPTNSMGAMGGLFLDAHMDGRLLDDPNPIDSSSLGVICQSMQVNSCLQFFGRWVVYTKCQLFHYLLMCMFFKNLSRFILFNFQELSVIWGCLNDNRILFFGWTIPLIGQWVMDNINWWWFHFFCSVLDPTTQSVSNAKESVVCVPPWWENGRSVWETLDHSVLWCQRSKFRFPALLSSLFSRHASVCYWKLFFFLNRGSVHGPVLILCMLSLCGAGRYVRSNLNMPPSLPARSGGYRDYDKDCPITVFGATQARLVGRSLITAKYTLRVRPSAFLVMLYMIYSKYHSLCST